MDSLFCFNIDDYHSIHGWRVPNTTTLSTANHMATCVSKLIENCCPVPAVHDNVFIHNPLNIEALRINRHLLNEFKGVFDISYNMRKAKWITENPQSFNEFNRISLLLVHFYDASILERHHERSMKGVRIVEVQERSLHSLDDYVQVLLSISKIESISEYLKNNIIPVSADWPGQLFIRKAITKIQQQEMQGNFDNYNIIKNFVPLIGPLHVSLNSREHIIKIHWEFFNKLFHYVFGPKKILAKKPKPWRVNLLLDLADKKFHILL